jgi:hypothetical protein
VTLVLNTGERSASVAHRLVVAELQDPHGALAYDFVNWQCCLRDPTESMTTIHLPRREEFVPLGDSFGSSTQRVTLEHRLPRIVWACGESFARPHLSIGSELLRHGFKEWSGIKEIETVGGVEPQGCLTRSGVGELLSATLPRHDFADLPIVICRDVHAPARIIEQASLDGRISLAYLGSPEDPELRLHRWPFRPAIPPIPMPEGMTPDSLVWLGAGDHGVRGPKNSDGVTEHLQQADMHLRRATPLGLWLVIDLDRLRLGRPGPGYLEEGVAAAMMRWAQGLVIEGGVILLSESRLPHERSMHASAAAQVMGQALHRNRTRVKR